MKVEWISGPPTEPGWYWLYDPEERVELFQIGIPQYGLDAGELSIITDSGTWGLTAIWWHALAEIPDPPA